MRAASRRTGSAWLIRPGRADEGRGPVRDGYRRLRSGLWIAVALGVMAGLSPRLVLPSHPSGLAAGVPAAQRRYEGMLAEIGKIAPSAGGGAVAEAAAALAQSGQTESVEAQEAGVLFPAGGTSSAARTAPIVPVVTIADSAHRASVQPLRTLRPADLLVVAPTTLPATVLSRISRERGVTAAVQLDAARIKVNGSLIPVLGVNPSAFRPFAARPTARSTALWQNVAGGAIAVSYLMGKQERLPLGGAVTVVGTKTEKLTVGGFGTVGIGGVDAVVSDRVARSLGMPAGNAIVISAPHARLSALIGKIQRILPKGASAAPLVAQAAEHGAAGSAGAINVTASDGPGLTVPQIRAFLKAALSRVGMAYVWGGDGPTVFDCSGLVQWSMRQAGIVMPRVADEQAQTGPLVPLSELEPGDLLFYHTDPTAPEYISHVAIYLGNGLMVQAPEPGMDVEVVPAILGGTGFAGAVEVYPRVAAAVAAENPVG
jgi:peptidoglycan DL-endopeptidase CwlO